MKKNAGKGWVIIEVNTHNNDKNLISILDARLSENYIKKYMEQTYIDKYASIEEKIKYKSNRSSWPYRVSQTINMYGGILDCGHNNMFVAYKCHHLQLNDNSLTFTYNIYKGGIESGRPIFDEKTQSITE